MASGRRSALHPRIGTTLHARGSLLDAGLLAAVPFALLAMFSLPAGAREAYVLRYAEPTLVTMYASHFVHRTPIHLAANIAGYAAVVPAAYLSCLLAGRRRLFRVAFVSTLLSLPPGLSALNLLYFERAVAFGFSGVLLGFFGLLALSLYLYAADRAATAVADRHAPVAFFIAVAMISVAIAPATRASLAIGVGALLCCGLYIRHLPGVLVAVRRLRDGFAGTPPGYLELGAVSTLLYFGYPFVAFPADPAQGGTVVNLYTHVLGFALGFISAFTYLALPGTGR
jgi:uncharacterized membrane protein YgdD (TMEM256/DUF423 family)